MARHIFRRWACPGLVWAYAIVSVLALLLIPATSYGLFGLTPDPLAGVYAILLGQPWISLLSPLLEANGPVSGFLLVAAGLTLNTVILRAICWYFSTSRP